MPIQEYAQMTMHEGSAGLSPSATICELADTEYGRMLLPVHDMNQTRALRATRRGVHHDRMLMLADLLKPSPPGRVVVDAGANLGAFAMGLAPSVDGWLHAFEPQPVLCNMLAGTAALSQRLNVRVHNVCLGNPSADEDRIEVPQFNYGSDMNFGSIEFGPRQVETLNQARGSDPARVEFVPLRALDWYRFERLDLMKIDVQRMEIALLDGAEATLARCRPVLFVEWIGNDTTELRSCLSRHGYRVEREVVDDWLCLPV